MAKAGSIQRKMKRKSGIGSFLLGTLVGFLLCIGALVGLGFFVYYNVSIDWLNNTFNTNIETGYRELDKKTLNEVVNVALGVFSNIENYSIDDIEKDFGITISDEIMSLDITTIKQAKFSEISEAITTMVGSLTANQLKETGLVDLSGIDFIFNKTNTYYYNSDNGTICRHSNLSGEICKVNVKDGKVIFDDRQSTINPDNSVDVKLGDIPLSIAMADFGFIAGDKMTIGELESQFNVELPSYLKNIDRSATINQLQNEMGGIKLGDILGYKYSSSQELYYLDDNNDGNYDVGEEIKGVAKVVAYTTISEVGNKIANLQVQDVFDITSGKGILALIPANTEIENIANTIETQIKTVKIGELVEKEILTIDNYDADKIIPGSADKKISEVSIQELMQILFD